MSELKHFLRKHEFPNCAREALVHVEQLCCQTASISINLNQQRLIQDIMDEFIFCECDRRGLRKKRLNAIQELHLLDILCTYFEGQKNPIVANIVFLTLFHYQREPGASMYKMKVLTKLVSTAVVTRSVGTLNCSAVWMQQQGCTSDVVVALARELIKDYLELFPRGTSDLQELPRISLHFSAHFITALTPMYGRLGDRVVAPPIDLLKCIAHWITTYPHLCLTPLVTNLQGALPKGSIVMPACVPLPGLIRWCVEGPLIVGIGVDGRVTKRTDEGEDAVGGRSVVYSRLHLAVLESMMETRKLRDRMAQTDVISVRDLVSVCDTIAASIKASVDIYVDSEERIRLALDRFGQALQISLTTGCLRGNLDELWSSFARLPSNRLIQMVIMSCSNQKVL